MVEMNTKIKRVRTAGEDYLRNQQDYRQNQRDFPRVVLAYGRALLQARKAVGDDDRAFGSWLAAHRLNHVPKNDRVALLSLAKHPKIATKVLRETTSRSVRLIWENEVRPRAPFPALGQISGPQRSRSLLFAPWR
jgi:hypothetical protein